MNTGLIANVTNAVLLRGLLNASQAKLKDMREIHDLEIEIRGGSTSKAGFLKPGKYSHVTWLGGSKAKY